MSCFTGSNYCCQLASTWKATLYATVFVSSARTTVTSRIVLLSTIWARFSVSFLLRSDSHELVTLGATAPHVLPYAVLDSR